MNFKVFKQEGKEIIVNLDLITHIMYDTTTKKVCLLGTPSNYFYVDASLDDVKKTLNLAKADFVCV